MDTTETETISAFCKRLGLTLTVDRIGHPLMGVTKTKDGFRCKCFATISLDPPKGIEAGDGRYPSTRGYRCKRCSAILARNDAQLHYRVTLGREGSTAKVESPYSQGSAYILRGAPTLEDVVTSLRSDAQCYRFNRSADEFIRELGYMEGDGDPLENVRRGEAAYLACGETFRGLCDLLGMSETEHLIERVEED